MRKILVSIIIILMALSIAVTAYAQEIGVNEDNTDSDEVIPRVEVKIKPSKSDDGKTIVLTLELGNFTNVKDNAMLGYEAILNYEEDIFKNVEAKDVKGLNGWTSTYSPITKKIIGDPIEGEENTDITEITLHLKDTIEAENTTVSLTNFLLADDDENDLYTSNLPVEISIKQEETISKSEIPSESEDTKTPSKNETQKPADETLAKVNRLPKAGNTVLIIGIVSILIIIAFGVISGKGYIGYLKDTHKQIKK